MQKPLISSNNKRFDARPLTSQQFDRHSNSKGIPNRQRVFDVTQRLDDPASKTIPSSSTSPGVDSNLSTRIFADTGFAPPCIKGYQKNLNRIAGTFWQDLTGFESVASLPTQELNSRLKKIANNTANLSNHQKFTLELLLKDLVAMMLLGKQSTTKSPTAHAPFSIVQINTLFSQFGNFGEKYLRSQLNYLENVHYGSLSPVKRFYIANLYKIKSPSLRDEIISDPLWQKTLNLSDATLSKLSSPTSTHEQQQYINGCIASSSLQSLRNQDFTPLELYHLATLTKTFLLHEIKHMPEEFKVERSWSGIGSPQKLDVCTQVLEAFDTNLIKLRHELEQLYDGVEQKPDESQDPSDPLNSWISHWSHAMQLVSSIANPREPVYLTTRPLKESWFASAVLMAAPSLVLTLSPGYPAFWDRVIPISNKFPQLIQDLVVIAPQANKRLFIGLEPISERLKHENSPGQLIIDFWVATRSCGGVQLISRFHCESMRAGVGKGGEPVLVSHDPKLETSRIFTLSEAWNYLRNGHFEAVPYGA